MSGMFSNLKRLTLSLVVIVSFGIYAIRQQVQKTELPTIREAVLPTSASKPVQVPSPLPTTRVPVPILTSTPTPNAGMYRDGQYSGAVADAYYGPLQVKAIIQGGKLVDVQFLQYPNDRGTSIEINSQALPLLKAQAIRIQNAQVDGVTGASATSPAFVQSLASALIQAK